MSDFSDILPQLTEQLSAYYATQFDLQKFVRNNIVFDALGGTFTPTSEVLAAAKETLANKQFVQEEQERIAYALLEAWVVQIPRKIQALKDNESSFLENTLAMKKQAEERGITNLERIESSIATFQKNIQSYDDAYKNFAGIKIEDIQNKTYTEEALKSESFRDAFVHLINIATNLMKPATTGLPPIEGYSPQAILDNPQAFIDSLQAKPIFLAPKDIDEIVAEHKGQNTLASRETTMAFLAESGSTLIINDAPRFFLPVAKGYGELLVSPEPTPEGQAVILKGKLSDDGVENTNTPGTGIVFRNPTDGNRLQTVRDNGDGVIIFGKLSEERANALQGLLDEMQKNKPLEHWQLADYKLFLQKAEEIYNELPVIGDTKLDCWNGKISEKVLTAAPMDGRDIPTTIAGEPLARFAGHFHNNPDTQTPITAIYIQLGEDTSVHFQGDVGKDPQKYHGREGQKGFYITVSEKGVRGVQEVPAFISDWKIKMEDNLYIPSPDSFMSINPESKQIVSLPNEQMALLAKASPTARESAFRNSIKYARSHNHPMGTIADFQNNLREFLKTHRLTRQLLEESAERKNLGNQLRF